MKNAKTQEQLYNRIMINFGIGILAYGLLYFLYQKMYMNNLLTFSIAGIFALAAIVFYILSGKKPVRNYAHMFAAFSIALLFTRLSLLFTAIFGAEKFFEFQNFYFFKKIMQTRIEVTILVVLGATYLLGMLVYNLVLMHKAGKKSKQKQHSKK